MRQLLEKKIPGIDGTPLYFRAWGGDGPALIASDGIGCAGYAWPYIIRQFSDRYTILRWHYPGHGQSGSPQDLTRLSIEDLCDNLALVMEAAGVESGIHLGHSMGVQVILEMHRRHRDKVQGLVPICGSYGRPLATFKNSDFLERVVPLLSYFVRERPRVSNLLWSASISNPLALKAAKMFEINRYLTRDADFLPYLEHLVTMDARVFLGMLSRAGEHSAYDHLEHIDVPTLIVAAEKDGFTPTWLSDEMHRLIPDSELLFIPTGSHTAPIELPELLNLRLQKFLDMHFK